MDNGFSVPAALDIDNELIQQCDEIRSFAKKDWFKPASVSLQQLDQVKAKVYNIGLADPRKFRAVSRKPPPSPTALASATATNLSDLHAEPPLSTVSYQKAAWGSTSDLSAPIPDVVRKAGGGGTHPSRPSSAKVASYSRPLSSKKSRPSSAKDPLCPSGKKKTALGVKGQRYDAADKQAGEGRGPLSLPGSVIGWAGPPAGLNIPSGQDDVSADARPASAKSPQQDGDIDLLPSAPCSSPEPTDSTSAEDFANQARTSPAEGLHLSFSLPSADAEVPYDEPDTGRLLEEADNYVKTQSEKEANRIKIFQADRSNGILTKGEFQDKTDLGEVQGTPGNLLDLSDGAEDIASDDDAEWLNGEANQISSSASNSFLYPEISSTEIGSLGKEHSSPSDINTFSDHRRSAENSEEYSGGESHRQETATADELKSTEVGSYETELPPEGSGLEYLGPMKKEPRRRSHPIFLEPENKIMRKQVKLHPPSDTDGKASEAKPQHQRVGVHIREDRNVTVDITPRNIGRKVTEITSSSRSPARDEVKGRPTSQASHLPLSSGQDNLEVTAVKVQQQGTSGGKSPTPASTVTVFYDDDSDGGSQMGGKKKRRRRPGPRKESDIVTMVGDMALSDDDDPQKEVDLLLGDEGDDSITTDSFRSPSVVAFSAGEKNYYDVARHRQPAGDGPDKEEKENFITMTTKTFEFDKEKPRESIVRKILEAPQLKQKEKPARPPSASLTTRPKSAPQKLRSAKLTVSDMYRVTSPGSKPHGSSEGGLFGRRRSDDTFQTLDQSNEERPLSRMGFFSEENVSSGKSAKESSLADTEGKHVKTASEETVLNREDSTENSVSKILKEVPSHRPPSGKRRPHSATHRTKKAGGTDSNLSQKETATIRSRPSSASSVGHSPSASEIQRANAAARALRSEEATASSSRLAAATRCAETRRDYARSTACNTHSGTRQRRAGLKSAPARGRPVYLNSKSHLSEDEESENVAECRQIQDRLACYGIDIKTDALERALFPPSGKTLHYDIAAELPRSYSTGLLSHPRYWLPAEYKKLKLAEKQLAMAELSLWRQKKAEERRAKLAAGKEPVKGKGKGKKKKKKAGTKLCRSHSIC